MPRFFRFLAACAGLLITLPHAFAQPAPQVVASRDQPASIEGLWCGIGLLHDYSIQVHQKYREFEAMLHRRDRSRPVTGRIEGDRIVTDPQKNIVLELRAIGDELRITNGTGQFALARGQGFFRAPGASCGA